MAGREPNADRPRLPHPDVTGPYRKATLIQEALATLRAAHAIDERDELDAASWLEWYDRTLPDVRDIKMLAGAMEIELGKRRGQRVIEEGERRGRPEKVDLDETLSKATRDQRHRDRALAKEPAAVDAFVKREVTAGRVPTVTGAVRAATAARAGKASRPQASQTRVDDMNARVLATLDTLADGLPRTDAQLAKVPGVGHVPDFLRRVRLIPWLRIDRTAAGLLFHVDDTLRALCEGRRPRPALSYDSIHHFLRDLRAAITRKRKENHDEARASRWNPQLIIKREQSDLLDWIEEQLGRVPPD